MKPVETNQNDQSSRTELPESELSTIFPKGKLTAIEEVLVREFIDNMSKDFILSESIYEKKGLAHCLGFDEDTVNRIMQSGDQSEPLENQRLAKNLLKSFITNFPQKEGNSFASFDYIIKRMRDVGYNLPADNSKEILDQAKNGSLDISRPKVRELTEDEIETIKNMYLICKMDWNAFNSLFSKLNINMDKISHFNEGTDFSKIENILKYYLSEKNGTLESIVPALGKAGLNIAKDLLNKHLLSRSLKNQQ